MSSGDTLTAAMPIAETKAQQNGLRTATHPFSMLPHRPSLSGLFTVLTRSLCWATSRASSGAPLTIIDTLLYVIILHSARC
jgi:hypothetical protein